MLPLISIFKFIGFILSVTAAFHLRKSWQKDPQDKLVYSFYRFFFYLSFNTMTFLILPFETNPSLIQINFYFANFFTFMSLAYISRIVFYLTFFPEVREYVFWTMISLGFLDLALGVVFFKPALTYTYQLWGIDFIGWFINWPSTLMFLHALLIGILTIFCFFLFFIKGFTLKDHSTKVRSSFLGLGAIIMSAGALSFYIFGPLTPASLVKDLIHGLATVLGLIAVLIGIYYKKKE
jgi:uncharacterized integral membrane protein